MLASSIFTLALIAGSSAAPMAKRSYTGQATYFAPGMGACGWSASDSDYIVALNTAQYGNTGQASGYCGQTITITNTANGNSHTAKVQDACPSCDYGSLDMSPALFSALNNGNMGAGVFSISWTVGSGSSNSGSPSSSTYSSSSSTPSSSSSASSTSSSPQPKQTPYSAPIHEVSSVAPTGQPNTTFTTEPQWWATINPAYCNLSTPSNVTVAAVGPTQAYNGTNLSDACGKWIQIHNQETNKTAMAMVVEYVPGMGDNFLALADGYKALANMQGSMPNPISNVTWGFVETNSTTSSE
ncbi:hypothetical protein K437DRAFT_272945 [Tilletiaria anomala UBC 951]|uniref:Barwin domain-containing protein n=1 Tax=Tilletiaria anomala (strain ATCC 24038 / CBS 436.72 / UBC 951) TaxID=1037660 RepID=A0A066WLD6_TILAU|nr:uncharacterized protein K437DRAFT_272945 [Tilletiaria anomala UBC 951]KDN51450.1 hypothetical protein K437DRAFT_272945 [Tilletiaria anomala UBC 951]